MEGVFVVSDVSPLLRLVSWLSRLLLAAVFIYGGVPKLFSPNDFAVIISAYGLLPDPLVLPAAFLLPLLEIIIAIGLLLDNRWAVAAALILLLFFIAVLSYGMSIGLDIDCGCFGLEDPEYGEMSGLAEARFRDLLFLIPAGFCCWFSYLKKEK